MQETHEEILGYVIVGKFFTKKETIIGVGYETEEEAREEILRLENLISKSPRYADIRETIEKTSSFISDDEKEHAVFKCWSLKILEWEQEFKVPGLSYCDSFFYKTIYRG
jgi:hypothetical protein